MAQRALFIPHLRAEAPEGLTAGKDFHVSLCLCRHDSCQVSAHWVSRSMDTENAKLLANIFPGICDLLRIASRDIRNTDLQRRMI